MSQTFFPPSFCHGLKKKNRHGTNQKKGNIRTTTKPEKYRTLARHKIMSEVGFEPTPTRVDCDLNAAP